VEAIELDRLLRLRAEMVIPGEAWLQLEAVPLSGGQTQVVQTILMATKGFLGFLYWYALYPFHGLIFGKLVRRISEEAEARADRRARQQAEVSTLEPAEL
jgi:hypothetical protein